MLTLCKHAVTTPSSTTTTTTTSTAVNTKKKKTKTETTTTTTTTTDVAAMRHGLPRNWIFRLETEIKYARLPRDGIHFLKLETAIHRLDRARSVCLPILAPAGIHYFLEIRENCVCHGIRLARFHNSLDRSNDRSWKPNCTSMCIVDRDRKKRTNNYLRTILN